MICPITHIYRGGGVDSEMLLGNIIDSRLKNYHMAVVFPLCLVKDKPVYYII